MPPVETIVFRYLARPFIIVVKFLTLKKMINILFCLSVAQSNLGCQVNKNPTRFTKARACLGATTLCEGIRRRWLIEVAVGRRKNALWIHYKTVGR